MSIESSPSTPVNSEPDSIIFIKDISRTGICIISHFELLPEAQLFIRFQKREVRAVVSRSRWLGEFCWECGAEITQFTNLEEE
jgi:hypothetical protein